MLADGEWYRILSGEHEGRLHMTGWKLSAIKGESTGLRDDGWLSYAICPVCAAMVFADDHKAYGDQTWAHERWHAGTDHPVPADLLASEGWRW
jgi:hypothetical protein